MSDRKKPGKNSSRMGRKKPVSTADEAYESTAIPSPFLRAGFDIGVDISVPPRQNSKDTTVLATACDASGQADATTTTTTTNTNTFASHTPGSSAAAASTKKSSSAQATKRGRAIISNKKALALDALGLKDDNTPATNKKSKAPKAPKASKAAPATPKKPKEGKTAAPPKVTPSKRTHDASFPDLSYWSSTYIHHIFPPSHLRSHQKRLQRERDSPCLCRY